MDALLGQLGPHWPDPDPTMPRIGRGSLVILVDTIQTNAGLRWLTLNEWGGAQTFAFEDIHVRGPMPAEWRTNELAGAYVLPKYGPVLR